MRDIGIRVKIQIIGIKIIAKNLIVRFLEIALSIFSKDKKELPLLQVQVNVNSVKEQTNEYKRYV